MRYLNLAELLLDVACFTDAISKSIGERSRIHVFAGTAVYDDDLFPSEALHDCFRNIYTSFPRTANAI